RRPSCMSCPLSATCVAYRTGRQEQLPTPRQARARPLREVFMLAAVRDDGDVLLERRPESGVWGGLWCLPEFASVAEAGVYAQQALDGASARPTPLAPVEHAFTHFQLVITPLLAHCSGSAGAREARLACPDPAAARASRRCRGVPTSTLRLTGELDVARMVQCVVLKREAPGFDRPPYPGDLGRRIYESVSREAWARWLQHQTMLINEY